MEEKNNLQCLRVFKKMVKLNKNIVFGFHALYFGNSE